MHGEYRFPARDPNLTASAYADALAIAFARQQPGELERSGSSLAIDARWLPYPERWGAWSGLSISSRPWRLIAMFSSAAIDTIPAAEEVVVRYDIRFTGLIAYCKVLTALSLAGGLVGWSLGAYAPWLIPVSGCALIWGWLFPLHYALAGLRLRHLLRSTARRLEGTGSGCPDAG